MRSLYAYLVAVAYFSHAAWPPGSKLLKNARGSTYTLLVSDKNSWHFLAMAMNQDVLTIHPLCPKC